MKDSTKSTSTELLKTLSAQKYVLDTILEQQKVVRSSVIEKNWDSLQVALEKIETLSNDFTSHEVNRIQCSLKLNPKSTDDIFEIVKVVPSELKVQLIEVFQQVKRSLLVSKIENDAINEYIRVTQSFMQKIFDEVLPQRRNTVYSSNGEVIKNQPTSVLLDTVA